MIQPWRFNIVSNAAVVIMFSERMIIDIYYEKLTLEVVPYVRCCIVASSKRNRGSPVPKRGMSNTHGVSKSTTADEHDEKKEDEEKEDGMDAEGEEENSGGMSSL